MPIFKVKPDAALLSEYNALKQQVEEQKTKIELYKASDSTTMVKAKAVDARNSELIEELFNVSAINKKYNTDIKNLYAAMKTWMRDTVLIKQDTVYLPAPEFNEDSSAFTLTGSFNNPWYAVRATVSSNPMKLAGNVNLVVIDSVTYLFEKKKSGGLFNRKEDMYVNIRHANPFIKEKEVSLVRVPYTPVKKKWSIGVGGGINILGGRAEAYGGIGIYRNLLSW